MKKIKYYYNTSSLRYEKLETPLRIKLLRVFGFIAAALVTAMLISYLAFRFIGSPGEKLLRIENERMKDRYKDLTAQLNSLQAQMRELEKRDNDVYRTIFEADPIPDSARAKDLEKQIEIAAIESMDNAELLTSISFALNNLTERIKIQTASYNEVMGLIDNKEKLLAHTPAIQPVSNKDLERIASGFGYRIDPIYKTVKLHPGLDFTAPTGTPIYATADGTIETAGFGEGGYGHHVIINHSFGYKTLYAHMVRIKARPGQKVIRGEVIGYVGSSGKSTGPHLHYEVIRRGQKIDPVYFFYNDLTPEQFDRLLKKASVANQSFD
jgi:murein DD-endopeptidase MepM/ murein hydrolase activator NlpD